MMTLFVELLGAPEQNKPLICLLTSMILKKKYPVLGLVQKAISLLLYGNGTHKLVSLVLI